MSYKILAINPGSTSTKIAVFHDDKQVFSKSIQHDNESLAPFKLITDQIPFRQQLIEEELAAAGIPLEFDAVIGRGGVARSMESGVYAVNEKMLYEMRNAMHQHACDIGCILADAIANKIPGCPSFIADPGSVDELNDYARISGSPVMPRIPIWHALNQRAIARRFAKQVGRRYEDMNLIISHLGGGISVTAHEHGRATDTNNALDGEGPFSPERAGTLPASYLIHLCYSGKYTQEQLLRRVAGKAGLNAHLGDNDMRRIVERIENGDEHARLIVDAMCYHIAKNIAAQGAVLFGKVDAILLTGGIANCEYVISRIIPRVQYLAPVYVFPGEDEMSALAENALGAITGTMQIKTYE